MTINISTIKNVNRNGIPCLADKTEENRLKNQFLHTANTFIQTAFSANKTYLFSDDL